MAQHQDRSIGGGDVGPALGGVDADHVDPPEHRLEEVDPGQVTDRLRMGEQGHGAPLVDPRRPALRGGSGIGGPGEGAEHHHGCDPGQDQPGQYTRHAAYDRHGILPGREVSRING